MFGAGVRRSMTEGTLTWLRGEFNTHPDNGFVFHIAVHIGLECARAVFSLTTEGEKEDQSSRVAPSLLKRSDPLTRAALMICGPRRTSGRAPCGIFERESERGMNWTDKAGRENTVRLNNSKPTGGMLERDRSRDLSLAVCSHMLTVILAVCLNP